LKKIYIRTQGYRDEKFMSKKPKKQNYWLCKKIKIKGSIPEKKTTEIDTTTLRRKLNEAWAKSTGSVNTKTT